MVLLAVSDRSRVGIGIIDLELSEDVEEGRREAAGSEAIGVLVTVWAASERLGDS